MLRNGCLFTGRKTPVQSYRFATGSAYLIGSLRNKRLLHHLATHFTGGVPVVNGAEVLYQLSTQLGSAALGLAEGDFCLLYRGSQWHLDAADRCPRSKSCLFGQRRRSLDY
ncbi:MAG: carbapenam-3-carboxylate synthase domain-containing protein [Sodalis sp. (in: enterobacteria)]|uniref:carbapenam-3-carboxylate synthase domain-containing protein n=1 Tax=Sodalis sp. (in: enterobacteria) TaxID=1898979 RepID=UPI0039E68810